MKKSLIMISTVIVSLIGGGCYFKSTSGKGMKEYLLVQQSYSKDLNLPFVYFGEENSREIYKDALFGVELIEISINGDIQKATTFNTLIDDIDSSKIKISGGYVYLVGANKYHDSESWRVVFNRAESGEVNLVEYSIPRKASNIRISYRINLPNRKFVGKHTLIVKVE